MRREGGVRQGGEPPSFTGQGPESKKSFKNRGGGTRGKGPKEGEKRDVPLNFCLYHVKGRNKSSCFVSFPLHGKRHTKEREDPPQSRQM